ncbi:MAG: hypothetical protein ACYTGX_19700, partial [Planctomycetota bacterium]
MATTVRTIGILGAALAALVAMALGTGPAHAQEEADPNAKVFRNHKENVQIRCPNCLHDEAKGRSADAPAPRAPVSFKQGSTCPICAGSGFLKTSVDWTAGFYFAEGFGVPPKADARRYRDADSDKER